MSHEKTTRNKRIVRLYKTGRYSFRRLGRILGLDVSTIWRIVERGRR